MLAQRIGLMDQTGTIDARQLDAVAASLSVQIMRDLSQFWPVSATVQALPAQGGVPPGVIPVFIMANLPPGEGGVHLSDHNQPYANVAVGDGWMLAASHEVCELLVDPSTNRLQAATALAVDEAGNVSDIAGQFEYLVEVCDPSESPEHGYVIGGIPVSDFYTPSYFDPVTVASARYSFTGALTAPRQVLKGGYLSWHDPIKGIWQQLDYVNYDKPTIVDLGDMTASRSLRERIDGGMKTTHGLSATPADHALMQRAASRRDCIGKAASANAGLYLPLRRRHEKPGR